MGFSTTLMSLLQRSNECIHGQLSVRVRGARRESWYLRVEASLGRFVSATSQIPFASLAIEHLISGRATDHKTTLTAFAALNGGCAAERQFHAALLRAGRHATPDFVP